MATYRIVDMYRKNKPINGIHYDSWDNPILAYRVDKRHSLLFGLIHYWDHGAYNLCPEYGDYIEMYDNGGAFTKGNIVLRYVPYKKYTRSDFLGKINLYNVLYYNKLKMRHY